MGISMLGSLLTGILDGIKSVFVWLINKVTGLLIKYVIAPVISVCLNLVMYMLGLFFYNISVFILALIDYVEILFRLLAGLEVDNMRLVLNNGESGFNDLLLQLITSESVTQAFLSMCIVGLFLLVITTIFQMIKVEYTTEGSHNAKGPILEKAFKGVANLMLLPILVVFGVFIGNQVLDLIDTATKGGGDSPTISGTLFVTAASEAMWKSNELRVRLETGSAIEVIINVIPIAWNSVIDAWGATSEEDKEFTVWQWDSPISGEDVTVTPDAVENGFINQEEEFKYWNISQVTRYYDYSEINYLLLIFGGCIVIKTLYFACFGMVTRLYRCAVLYIVSPMVIGMSPVNDSGMKKWQQSFIGSAISAYGVVIALNVFFIVVKILLSIEFEFATWHDYFLGASLMEGLLKCIFVIGGCTMIEKFSKELGGYFGAEDALSAGKELEKATKDEVKKGIEGTVKTALTVGSIAMGGAGIAASIGKQGLGGTIKSGVKNLGSKALEKGQAVADYMGVGDQFDAVVGAGKDIKSRNASKYLNDGKNKQEYNNAIGKIENDKKYLENKNLSKSTRKKIEKDLKKSEKVVSKYENQQNIVNDYKNYTSKPAKFARGQDRMVRQETSKQVGKGVISDFGGWGAGVNSGKKIIADAMKAYGDTNGKDAGNAVKAYNARKAKAVEEKHNAIYKEQIASNKALADFGAQQKMAKAYQKQQAAMDAALDSINNFKKAIDDASKAKNYNEISSLTDARNEEIKAFHATYGNAVKFDAAGNVDKERSGVSNINFKATIENISKAGLNQGLSGDKLADFVKKGLEKELNNLYKNSGKQADEIREIVSSALKSYENIVARIANDSKK